MSPRSIRQAREFVSSTELARLTFYKCFESPNAVDQIPSLVRKWTRLPTTPLSIAAKLQPISRGPDVRRAYFTFEASNDHSHSRIRSILVIIPHSVRAVIRSRANGQQLSRGDLGERTPPRQSSRLRWRTLQIRVKVTINQRLRTHVGTRERTLHRFAAHWQALRRPNVATERTEYVI